MGPNILSGLDRIRITQTRLLVKNFCIVVALIIKCAYYWDGLAYILHFISVVICKSNVKMCFRRIFTQGSPFQLSVLKTRGTVDVSTY